jgi:hypothetical protein
MQDIQIAISERVSVFDRARGGLFVLCGDPSVHMIAYDFVKKPLANHRIITVIDGGNVFDPYAVTRMAHSLGQDPRAFLSRILISRSFTCHQTQALTRKVLASFNAHQFPLILVLGLLTTFYDEEVPIAERRQLLEKTLHDLKEIAQRGTKVLITSPDAQSAAPAAMSKLLIDAADAVARLDPDSDGLSLAVLKEVPEQAAVAQR